MSLDDAFRELWENIAAAGWGPEEITRNLHDWTKEFPTIVQGVSQLKATNAMIDGEAFVADVGGMS
ncbi:hypothetical protein SAMN04488498_1411, partial [Mesorhizobium albiziae]